MEEQKISIIVPIYNVELYLERCIRSICDQTHKNLEIILVDDGSTDNSGKICDTYAVQDPRIQVIHKKNGGVVSARKAGLAVTTGTFVGFADGDDYLEPEMYTQLLEIICREQVDFVHSGYLVDEKAGIYGTGKDAVFQISPKETVKYLRELVLNPIGNWKIAPSSWSKLYDRDLIKMAYWETPDELSFGEDLLCFCNCILKCTRFSISSKAYYHYVTRESSACNRKSTLNIKRENDLYDALCNLFAKHGLLSELQGDLEQFYLYSVTASIKHLGNRACPLYQYPTMDDLMGKKIILYGAGEVGQDYYTQMRRDIRCEVLAITDTCYKNYYVPYMNLIAPEEIVQYDYDVIVIATIYKGIAEEIEKDLLQRGVNKDKILWKKSCLAI